MKKIYFLIAISILIACGKEEPQNNQPVIESISINPTETLPGSSVQLNAVVTDIDGDNINYNWSPEIGNVIAPNSQSTIWEIPSTVSVNKNYSIELTVTDGKSSTTKSVSIKVKSGITVSGYVHYKYTEIPIVGANVSIGNNSTITTEEGYFELFNVSEGLQEIDLNKSGFDNITINETISYSNKDFEFDMTSNEFTQSVYGTVQASDGTPISSIEVSLKNPDGTISDIKSMSNSSGEYNLDFVPIGERTISVIDKNPDVNTYEDNIELDIIIGSSSYNLNPVMLIRRTINLEILNPNAWTYISPDLYELQNDKLVLFAGCELIIELPFSFPNEFEPGNNDLGGKVIWFHVYHGDGNDPVYGVTCYADNVIVDFNHWAHPSTEYRLYKSYDWAKYRGSKAKFRFYSANGGCIKSASFPCYY